MFKDCSLLNSIDLYNFYCNKIKETNDMANMFEGCDKLKIQNIKHKYFKIRGQIIMDLNK